MSIKEILKKVKLAEGTISMLLGAAVVVVIGVLLFNYFRGVGQKVGLEETTSVSIESIEEGEITQASVEPKEKLPATYKVKANDHLWGIAEKFYDSGYNWIDIAKENKLNNANILMVDQGLKIPDVPVRQLITAGKVTSLAGEKPTTTIETDRYTVVKGDTLWSIAVRAYQDGFKWEEIARANSLANPNLIHPGNVLQLPR